MVSHDIFESSDFQTQKHSTQKTKNTTTTAMVTTIIKKTTLTMTQPPVQDDNGCVAERGRGGATWEQVSVDVQHYGDWEDDMTEEDAGDNLDEDDVETWKKRATRWRLNAHAAKMQLLQMHQPSSSMVSVPKAKGKNRQNLHTTSSADVSNKIQLNTYIKSTIWPHYKLLLFTGQWKRYDSSNPHALAQALMEQVTKPRSISPSDYYEEFVLPTFGAKMSSLKGNFIQAMYKAFKGALPLNTLQ